MIRERNPVTTINLAANSRQLTAGSGDSTAVRATCYLNDGSAAPAGILVRFFCIYGNFTRHIVPIEGNAGAAETRYLPGNHVGVDTLWAEVWGEEDTARSNLQLINLVPGPPFSISLRFEPPVLETGDPDAVCRVTATVLDRNGNPVRQGTFVSFSTTMGTITPSAMTDENGEAIAYLRPSFGAGIAQVGASVLGEEGIAIHVQGPVIFISGGPNTINLSADPDELDVGGHAPPTSTLTALISDSNLNNVEAPVTVVFELLNEPPPEEGGGTIGVRGQVYQTISSNGIAVAAFNPGISLGIKQIRVYTWPDSANNPDEIIEDFCTIVVRGGPHQISLDVNLNGEDAGGGAWRIEVSALVTDRDGNPVQDRIPVVFTVDPEIANIDPGFTGNDGEQGAPMPGVAYARLVYNSANTFDSLRITAEVQTQRGMIHGTRDIVLPLQEGTLELNAHVINREVDRETPGLVRFWVNLQDGHQISINNAPILFSTTRGLFYENDLENPFIEEPPIIVSDQGVAQIFLTANWEQLFENNNLDEVIVEIDASVLGYNVDSDPAFVFFTRGE